MRHIIITLGVLAVLCGCRARQLQAGLIRDCPEEKIINKMPSISQEGEQQASGSYFIYNGERRELNEFDLKWIEKNCNVKETEVH